MSLVWPAQTALLLQGLPAQAQLQVCWTCLPTLAGRKPAQPAVPRLGFFDIQSCSNKHSEPVPVEQSALEQAGSQCGQCLSVKMVATDMVARSRALSLRLRHLVRLTRLAICDRALCAAIVSTFGLTA